MSSYEEQLNKWRKVSKLGTITMSDLSFLKFLKCFKCLRENTNAFIIQEIKQTWGKCIMYKVLHFYPNKFAFDLGSQWYGKLEKSFKVYHLSYIIKA